MLKPRHCAISTVLPWVFCVMLGGQALAQDALEPAVSDDPGGETLARTPGESGAESVLAIDLNSAEPTDAGGCRLTFLITNNLPADLTQLSLETVILTAEGGVERLTLFDFRDIPQSRPRVRQFDLGGVACDSIGQVLINGAAACEGDGIEPQTCVTSLHLSSRAAMDLIG